VAGRIRYIEKIQVAYMVRRYATRRKAVGSSSDEVIKKETLYTELLLFWTLSIVLSFI
jgi:hypothetical protein